MFQALKDRLKVTADNVVAAVVFLGLLSAGAVAILNKKVKPE